MAKQIATNAPKGVAFTITTHLNQTGVINLVSGGGHYPSTGVIVIKDEKQMFFNMEICREVKT